MSFIKSLFSQVDATRAGPELKRYAPVYATEAESAASMKQLEERFVAWANTRSDIRAAIVIGSRARVERPADEWSDLDIVFFATNPEHYLSTVDWLRNIGNPLLTFVQNTPTGGQKEHRVLYHNGLDVDFTIVSIAEAKLLVRFLRLRKLFPRLLQVLPKEKSRKMMQEIADFASIIRRGMRVLIDKDGVAVHLPLINDGSFSSVSAKPSQSEFLVVLNEFWYFAVLMAKKLRRGELWTASKINNCSMKQSLLQMLEWHARATNNWDYDTWHGGSFIEHWADPRAVNALSNMFAHYDKEDIRNSLRATMDTFRWLAVETAEHLNFPYSTVTDERIKELLDQYLSEGTETPSDGSV